MTGVRLLAPSFSGKSTVSKEYAVRVNASGDHPEGTIPVLYVKLDAEGSFSSLATDMLRAMEARRPDSLTPSKRWERARRTARQTPLVLELEVGADGVELPAGRAGGRQRIRERGAATQQVLPKDMDHRVDVVARSVSAVEGAALRERLNVKRTKPDRLGRSIQGLIELAADLSARNVDFRSLTNGFDTSTPSGRLLFHILASVAEMEREPIKERTVAGLVAARARGKARGGRKRAMTPDMLDTARKLFAAGDKPAEVAKLLKVGRSTFYRHFPASERVSA